LTGKGKHAKKQKTNSGHRERDQTMAVHTYLFREGLWTAEGRYYDDSNRPIPLEGKTRITHQTGLWVNEGAMEIKTGDPPTLIHTRYEIIPFEEGRPITTWKSFNPAAGDLFGQFVIVEEAILSTCRSENDEFSGAEFLLKISDGEYLNRGIFLKGEVKLSSWAVKLRRIKDGPFPGSV
jgi:hypothetical protein